MVIQDLENNNVSLSLDTDIKYQDDRKEFHPYDTSRLSSSDTLPLSSLCLTRETTEKEYNTHWILGSSPRMTSMESGRSMVEMLGTLAIIGVLSIGGIAGYSYGMDKYRANETINDVNLRGIDLVRQVAMNQPLSLSEWSTISKAGYTISEPVLSAEGDAYFSISGVPKRVCEIVYDGIMQNQTTDVEVNGYVVDNSSACGDDNKMGFFFITNAGEGGTNPEDLCKNMTCPEGYSCTHGICMNEEVPPLDSNGSRYCNKDDECRECEYCAECQYCSKTKGICTKKEDGSYCRNSTDKICMNGYCAEDKTCEDNSECKYGYYCGKKDDNIKMCIKAEFYKLTLDTGEEAYLSQESLSASDARTDAKNICDSVGLKLVDDISKRQDILSKVDSLHERGDSMLLLSETMMCQVFFSSDYHICSTTSSQGHSVCVKENKVYDDTIVQSEPETEMTAPEETITNKTTTPVSGCYSNEECDSDEYCAPTAPTCTEAFPSGAPGTCKSLDFDKYTIIVNGTVETWYLSHSGIAYWEAQQACQRFGRMVNYRDLIDTDINTSGFGPATERAKVLFDAIGSGSPTSIYVQHISDNCYGDNNPENVCCGQTINMEMPNNWFVSGGNRTDEVNGHYKTLCKEM